MCEVTARADTGSRKVLRVEIERGRYVSVVGSDSRKDSKKFGNIER